MMTLIPAVRPLLLTSVLALGFAACQTPPPADRVRVSGQVEATEV